MWYTKAVACIIDNRIKVNLRFHTSGQRPLHQNMFFHTKYFTTSDNVAIRYGIWAGEGKPAGSVVLLNGRSEFLEKYEESAQQLMERGFVVFSFDWRGQGLSERFTANRHKGHVDHFDAYVTDLHEMMTRVVAPQARQPTIILAHSMGGHVALRWMHDHGRLWDRAVLSSPMIDIDTRPFPGRLVRFLARMMVKKGRACSYAPGNGDYDPDKQTFQGNKLTSDPRRFNDHIRAVKENPDLAVGGVTYGWLLAAFESIDIVRSPQFAAGITKPVLIAGAQRDRIVSVGAQKQICAMMPHCTFHLIRGARHEILKESGSIQSEFWKAFDAFAGKTMKRDY
jgi:lysophospholipase